MHIFLFQFGAYQLRIELLRTHGFEVEALHELRPHLEAVDPSYYDYVTVEWARSWPAEEIWVARKT